MRFQEILEFVYAYEHRPRNLDVYPVDIAGKIDVLQEGVDEDDPPPLAAHRSVHEAADVILLFHHAFVEVGDDPPRFFLPHVVQYPDDEIAHRGQAREIAYLVGTENLGHLDLAPGHEPCGKMVALGVVGEAFRRKDMEDLYEFLHVPGPLQFGTVGHAESERAEAQVLLEISREFHLEGFRVLVGEGGAHGIGLLPYPGFTGLHEYGQVGDSRLGHPQEIEARFLVEAALPRKPQVGDDGEEVGLVGIEYLQRFLVTRG